jgi:hypothetical protein
MLRGGLAPDAPATVAGGLETPAEPECRGTQCQPQLRPSSERLNGSRAHRKQSGQRLSARPGEDGSQDDVTTTDIWRVHESGCRWCGQGPSF